MFTTIPDTAKLSVRKTEGPGWGKSKWMVMADDIFWCCFKTKKQAIAFIFESGFCPLCGEKWVPTSTVGRCKCERDAREPL